MPLKVFSTHHREAQECILYLNSVGCRQEQTNTVIILLFAIRRFKKTCQNA